MGCEWAIGAYIVDLQALIPKLTHSLPGGRVFFAFALWRHSQSIVGAILTVVGGVRVSIFLFVCGCAACGVSCLFIVYNFQLGLDPNHSSICRCPFHPQAFNPPTAYPLIAAAFPADRVASVNGIYGSGMYAGGVSFFV